MFDSTARRAGSGILRNVWGTSALMTPVLAWESGRADKGEKFASFVAGGAQVAGTHTAVFAAGAALRYLGAAAVGPVGALALFAAGQIISAGPPDMTRGPIFTAFRRVQSINKDVRRLELGGFFEDTETSQAARMAAVRDMSSAHQAARSYLGREAMFFHRSR